MSEAIGLQNLTLPAGSAKIGDTQYAVQLNSSPVLLQQLNDLPIRTVAGSMVYVRDVAQVHDGQEPQINIVRVDGKRSVLLQPYLASVDKDGETALIFFDGKFSHAIRKGALLQKDEGPTRALFAPEKITARTPGVSSAAFSRCRFASSSRLRFIRNRP